MALAGCNELPAPVTPAFPGCCWRMLNGGGTSTTSAKLAGIRGTEVSPGNCAGALHPAAVPQLGSRPGAAAAITQ